MRFLSITLSVCCLAIASVLAANAAPTPAFNVLLACIESNPDGGAPLEMFGEQDGTSKWGVLCVDAKALNVWDALYPYRVSEEQKTETDHSRTAMFRFGRLSYCIKVIANADGTPGNHVECTLYLDLNDAIEKDIRLD